MPFEPALNEQERWARSLADMTAGTEMALYLIQNLGALVLTLIVLRGMLHASRANFTTPFLNSSSKSPIRYSRRCAACSLRKDALTGRS